MHELKEKYAQDVTHPLSKKPNFKNLLPCEWAATLDRLYPQLDTSFLESVHKKGRKMVEYQVVVSDTPRTFWSYGKTTYGDRKKLLPLPRYAVWAVAESHCNLSFYRIRHSGYENWQLTQCSRVIEVLQEMKYTLNSLYCTITTIIPDELKKQISEMQTYEELEFFIIAETKPEHWSTEEPIKKPVEADPMLVVTLSGKCWLMGIWDSTTGEEEVYLTYTS